MSLQRKLNELTDRDVMQKVLDIIEESGTGKTLSLLCSSLAWLIAKREIERKDKEMNKLDCDIDSDGEVGKNPSLPCSQRNMYVPLDWKQEGTRIVHTSRTHVQLSQAIG
ncbi:hypothetical protein B4U80_09390 [Leptotrombidium deliense]|uniref:AF-9 ANC1 homology domain-containing protein n=1 Tax=Leptotrombidium deliense TaxID=299467 RepID=A0A443RZ39_9ACAR|nr:hypothetical protein B4U80_09390 [Leptotrombidium deliense]